VLSLAYLGSSSRHVVRHHILPMAVGVMMYGSARSSSQGHRPVRTSMSLCRPFAVGVSVSIPNVRQGIRLESRWWVSTCSIW
jgi:hypothetical protein